MNEIIRKVVDLDGERHDLIREIGRGGQGVVYQVAGGKYAVKLFEDRSNKEISRLENQLKELRRIDLKDLPIARPIRILKSPYVGYVMTFFSGMKSMNSLVYPKNEPSIKVWYIKTGGLRHRLTLLMKIGDVLSEVHGKGLVYPDISPSNVFVSSSFDESEIGLIDADNIHTLSSPLAEDIVYTPGYGAPELVMQKSGVNSLTDAYAFAVLVFQTLALTHPFIGKLVEDDDEDFSDKDEEALSGKLPWIEHSTDKSNSTSKGIPRDWVLSLGIRKLASRTFEYFLDDPTGIRKAYQNFIPSQRGRPGIMEWREKLTQAAHSVLDCPECGASYYFSETQCPWCNCNRPPFVIIKILVWDPEKRTINQQTPFMMGCFSKARDFNISTRFYLGYIDKRCYEPLLNIQFDEQHLKVKNLSVNQYWISELNGNNLHEITSQIRSFQIQPGQASWCLHFGQLEKIHRVALFEVYP